MSSVFPHKRSLLERRRVFMSPRLSGSSAEEDLEMTLQGCLVCIY